MWNYVEGSDVCLNYTCCCCRADFILKQHESFKNAMEECVFLLLYAEEFRAGDSRAFIRATLIGIFLLLMNQIRTVI